MSDIIKIEHLNKCFGDVKHNDFYYMRAVTQGQWKCVD